MIVRHLDEFRSGNRILLFPWVGQGDEAALVEAVSLSDVLDGRDSVHDLHSDGGGQEAATGNQDLEAAQVIAGDFR